MVAEVEQLRAAQSLVQELARCVEARQGIQVQGQRVPSESLPEPVRLACQFYNDALTIPDDGPIGLGVAFLLPPETGPVYLVVGLNSECCCGAVEIYSRAGELLAAGIFVNAVAGWTDVATARQFVTDGPIPPGVLVIPATLEWIIYDPTACLSVGGRFFILPDFNRGGSPATRLEDSQTGITHECGSVAEAQALAAKLQAQGGSTA